jgi:hypothetical protein
MWRLSKVHHNEHNEGHRGHNGVAPLRRRRLLLSTLGEESASRAAAQIPLCPP